ncbi:hypothetical protein HYW75_05030 [Candidatus Pacearchaeota archaeon]|nr:hypothetical protein [Candidatus Pacearchaeota archaeon]
MIVKKKTFFASIIVLVIVLEIILSVYLLYAPGNNSYLCTVLGSCLEVQESFYGKMFGVKVALLGLISFILLILLYILSLLYKKLKNLYFTATLIGGFFAAYFLIIQFFILRKICSTCVLIDSLMILLLIFSIKEFSFHKREGKK